VHIGSRMRAAWVALAAFTCPCIEAFVVSAMRVSPAASLGARSVNMRMPWEPEPEPETTAAAPADEDALEKKKGITFEGLSQLITMGAGAPMLGDLKKVNLNKPEAEGGAALQFELEANNFEDENGNLKSGKYRDEGWVDEDAPDPMEALKKLWPFGGK